MDPHPPKNNELLTGKPLPLLIRLATPTAIFMTVQSLAIMVEAVCVGRLGLEPFAGVATVMPAVSLMAMMSSAGLGSGVAGAIARCSGSSLQNPEEQKQRLRGYALPGLVLGLAAGLFFMSCSFAFAPRLLSQVGLSPAAYRSGLDYVIWALCGAPFIWLNNLSASVLRGTGNVRTPALIGIAQALLLAALAPLGVSFAGAGGAGIAYFIAAAAGASAMLAALFRQSWWSGWKMEELLVRLSPLKDILRVGLPSSANIFMTAVSSALILVSAQQCGSHVLAALGCVMRLEQMLFPLIFAVGAALITLIGINHGAGLTLRVRKIAWLGALLLFGMILIPGALASAHPGWLFHLFAFDLIGNSEAIHTLRWTAWNLAPIAFALGLSFSCQGLNEPRPAFISAIARLAWVFVLFSMVSNQLIPVRFFAPSLAAAALLYSATLIQQSWRHFGFKLLCRPVTTAGASSQYLSLTSFFR